MLSETSSTALSVTGGSPRNRRSGLSASTKALETCRASSSGGVSCSTMGILHLLVAPAAHVVAGARLQQAGLPGAAFVEAQRAAVVEPAARRRIQQAGRRAG